MENEFFTLNEVSAHLNISKSTLYKLSETGKIPSVKIGKQLRFRKSSLDKWLTMKESGFINPSPDEPLTEGKETEPDLKHILIVDDDQLVLKSITKLLKAFGYDSESAKSGEEALEKVKRSAFDLIIMDIRMPGMDGVDTIEKIRDFYCKSQQALPQEILITGYMDTTAEEKADRLNITDCIYKPFAISEFVTTVKKKLEYPVNLN
ncbi:MAG: response regulator [Candidatus Omnitrophota bacterium]|nr:response regulator [Candidatus Omnitrophota bacterium]